MKANNVIVYMSFELAVLLLTGAFVYLKLIPNDLLILALGVIIRGALTIIPTTAALKENTEATKEDTAVTRATAAGVIAPEHPTVKHANSIPKT